MRKIIITISVFLTLCIAAQTGWAKDITVAFLVPLTGGLAFYGKIMRAVGQAVVDDINKGGINGFEKILVKIYDDGSDPGVTAQNFERAVAEGANVVWGGVSSSVEAMMVKKANELRVPTFLTNEHSDDAIPCNNLYAITPTMTTWEISEICANYFKANNVKTYAIIGADYLYPRTWDRALTHFLKGTGIKKVYENFHDFSKVDYSADIVKLRELKPDAIVRPYGGAGEYIIVKQLKDGGAWPRIYIVGPEMGGYQVTIDQIGEDYALDVIAVTTQDPKNPRWMEFAKTHKEKTGFWPTWLSQGMHDTLWVIKLGAEKAKTLEPAVLAKAMHEVAYEGVTAYPVGPFQESGYVQKGKINMLKFVKGSPEWTKDLKIHREVVATLDGKTPMCAEKIKEVLDKAAQ